jgi:PAS domain S-box-containing protein
MPFSTILTDHPLIRRLLELRRRPFLCLGIALGLVVFATLLRWSFGPLAGVPFITYFPAVTITALIAGYRAALLAAILSVAIALPLFGGEYIWSVGNPIVWTAMLFLVMAAVIITVVALLHKAVDQLTEQERNIRNLVESIPTGIVVVARDGHIHLVNASAEQLFGYSRQELLGRDVESLLPKRFATSHPAYRAAFNRKAETRRMGLGREVCGRRKDGSEFEAEIGLSALQRDTRSFTMATVIDVSERRRAQEREKLLARELHHRTQNLFTIIQAIITRSLREGRTIEESRTDLAGRLQALAKANQILFSGVFEGAKLREIISAEMSGFPSNVSIAGCDVEVNAQVAQQFALIVHELATNSVKYGALSTPDGRVSINGTAENDAFVFRWVETGGPLVKEPSRRGFGSIILEEGAKSLAEKIFLYYRPDGLRYELVLPLARLTLLSPEQAEGRHR